MIEKITGKAYFEAMKELVLDPAGITGNAPGPDPPCKQGRRRGPLLTIISGPRWPLRSSRHEGPVPWPYGGFYLEAMDSHGAWLASAADLLLFLAACDGRTGRVDILGASTLQDMTARPNLPDWGESRFLLLRAGLVRTARR